MLVLLIGLVLRDRLRDLTLRSGIQRAEQEAELIGGQFRSTETQLRTAVALMAATPELTSAVQRGDAPAARTAAVFSAALFRLGHIEIVDVSDITIIEVMSRRQDLSGGNWERADALRVAALGGVEGTDLIETDAALWLAAATPIVDRTRQVVGVLLVARELDDAFLREFNFNRSDISLALVTERGAQAVTTLGNAPIALNTDALALALMGRQQIVPDVDLFGGAPRVRSYVPVAASGIGRAVVVATSDVGSLVDFQQQIAATLLLITGLLALPAIGATLLLVRRIVTQPLRELERTTRALATGDYTRRARIRSNNEIGRVAGAFNSMADAVQLRDVELQHLAASLEIQNTDMLAETARREHLQQQMIQIQAAAIARLSTPIISISDQTIVVPLVGTLDAERTDEALKILLHGIEERRASNAIIDITGVPIIDAHLADALVRAAQAARMLGARVILTGVGPEAAQSLVSLGADLRGVATFGTLQAGIAASLRGG